MAVYRDYKTKNEVELKEKDGKFKFPSSGTRILLKSRPPIAKEVSTD